MSLMPLPYRKRSELTPASTDMKLQAEGVVDP